MVGYGVILMEMPKMYKITAALPCLGFREGKGGKGKGKIGQGAQPLGLEGAFFFFLLNTYQVIPFQGKIPFQGIKPPFRGCGVIRHPSLVWNGDWRRGVSPP